MLPALFVGVLVIPVQAQDLPDGAGKPVVLRICTGCHGAEMFASYRKGKDEWDQTITTMTEKGLAISDDDYAVVLQYLSTSLGPLPPKVNVNKASAAELEKALAITTQQAGAIVAYREKNGNFKDLDALKKVEGLDGATLDAKKESIAF